MDRVIFGDNQFFGVNHSSDEKSRSQAIMFRNNSAILDVLKAAHSEGINTFMCTTHDRMDEICQEIRNSVHFSGFKIYPCMPYAHKYANSLTENGIMGTIRQFVPGNLFGTLAKGGLALIKKDLISIMEVMIDAEMKMFRGISTPVIFLQNVITDLLLGLGMADLLVGFHEYIKKKHGAEPGFITMNLPFLLRVLEDNGIFNPVICASVNRSGFRMSGGVKAYEKIISEKRCRLIAMQVFGAGTISPSEALEYVCSQEGIHSILFGASSKNNIKQSKQMIEHYTAASQFSAIPL